MSKVAGLSYKKSRRLLQSLRDQQRHSLGTGFESANILLSPKYHLRDKDLREIHKAARVGDAARVQQLLLGKHCVNDRDKKKRTALHIACAYGHLKVVMALLEGRCEVDTTDSDGCTGLVKAVQCQEEECATVLLENGADPKIADAQGNSALHYAVYHKNTSLAAKLLEHRVNIEVMNKSGFTPFLLAISENKLKMANFLLMKNANVHTIDNQKRTALMHAVSHDSTNLVRFVLQQGVDLFSKDTFGLTAIDYAANFKHNTNMKILLEYKEKRYEKFESANQVVEEGSEDDSSRRKPETHKYGRDYYTWDSECKNAKEADSTPPTPASIQSGSLLLSSSSDPKEGPTAPGVGENEKEPAGGVTSVEEPARLDGGGNSQLQEGLAEPGTGREEQDVHLSAEPAGGVTSVEEPVSLDGGGNDQESATEPRTTKEEQDVTCTLAMGKEDDESSWDSESVSENLPLIRIDVDGLLKVNGQAVENPEKYLHWLPNNKRKDSFPNQMKEEMDIQAFTSAEPGLELTSEDNHKGLERNEDSQRQVEEERKQEWNEREASESPGTDAGDHCKDGSPLTRKMGEPGAQQSPHTDSKEQAGVLRSELLRDGTSSQSGSALNIKEEKKGEHEKQFSGDFVTALTSEESVSEADGPLRVRDAWSSSDTDPDKGRPAKRKSKEKHKVRREMNATEDSDDITQSSGPCSEDDISRLSDVYKTKPRTKLNSKWTKAFNIETDTLNLTEDKMDTDLRSDRQQTENENEPFELLTRQSRNTENSAAEEEAVETEPMRFRVALKQKERENERLKTQLPEKDGLCTEEIENQQLDMALSTLHMKVKQALKQLQEAQDRQREVGPSSPKMQDCLQKLQAECSEAEILIQQQAMKITELKKLRADMTRDKEEQLKKLNEIIPSLKCYLDQKKNKNKELEREFTEIKKHLGVMRKKLNEHENGEFSCHGDLKTKELEVNISMNMLKNEIHELREKWETINSKYLPLNVQFTYIEQELLSIKIAQKQYEKLHKDQKTLERDALDLQHQLRENMAKSEGKKHAMALRDSNNDSIMSQMELRIANLESELEKMEAEEESNARKVERYKQRCVKERELSKLLSHELNKTNSKLSKVRTDILLVTEWNRTVQNALSTRPVLKCTDITKHKTHGKCNPGFIPSRNPEPPPSSPQPPPEPVRKSLLKKQQKMVKDLAEEVDKAAAELESWSLEAYPSGSK